MRDPVSCHIGRTLYCFHTSCNRHRPEDDLSPSAVLGHSCSISGICHKEIEEMKGKQKKIGLQAGTRRTAFYQKYELKMRFL